MNARAQLTLLALAAAAATTTGLRVEDAGRWDWHKQLFKSVSDVSIEGKRVYVAADGLVGAVGKGGGVVWRRKVGGGGGWVEKISGGVLSVEKESGKTSLFMEDGSLAWEGTLPNDATPVGISGETGEEWPAVISVTKTTHTVKIHSVQVDGTHIKFGTVTEVPSPSKSSAVSYHVSQGVLYAITGADLHELQLSGQQWMPVKKLPFKNTSGLKVTHADAASISVFSKTESKCYLNANSVIETDDILKCVPGGDTTSGTPSGDVDQMWSKKMQGGGVKIVVRHVSGDLELINSWVRDDGLANAVSVKAYDIPTDETDDAEMTDTEEYFGLVQGQVGSAVKFINELPKMTTDAVELISSGVKQVHDYDSRENAFGLQKVLIFQTETTLTSLNTKDGSKNWQTPVATLLQSCAHDTKIKSFHILVSTHVQHSHPKIFVWTHSDASGDSIIEICPETGAATTTHTMSTTITAVFTTEKYIFHGYQTIAVVSGEAKTVEVFPKGAELVGDGDLLRYHMFSKETGVASGYAITNELTVKKMWGTKVLTADEEKVAATSLDGYTPFGYINTDAIYVHGNHSTGKNEVLTKYINPNAFVVVTAVPKKAAEEDSAQDGPKREGYLVLYLIDGVTGAILTSMVQTNAGGAVSITAMEHMYLYSFFNLKRKRYQLGVWSLFKDIDLYKGMTSESTTSLKYIMQAAVGLPANSYSSFEEASPQVVPAAFTFPSPVTAMSVTLSEKGVATKQLLVSLATDEIISIDIQKHIAANMQQGNTLVSWMPTAHLTYNLTAAGVTKLNTFPTKLESTCLVVAHGGDIFFTRTTSGKPFDVLPEDFEYTLLLLLSVAIIGLTFVLSVLSRNDALKAQWL